MHGTLDGLDVDTDPLSRVFTLLGSISTRTPWFLSRMCDSRDGRSPEAIAGRQQENPR